MAFKTTLTTLALSKLVICLNQPADEHFHVTLSQVCCVDVHFMHSAQLCVAFSLLFAFFFFFLWPNSHFREQSPLTDEQLVEG